MPELDPQRLLHRARHEADAALRRARNGALHLTGLAQPPIGQTPRATVWERDKATLWRCSPRSGGPSGTPVVIVSSLVSKSTIFDLAPSNSVVERLMQDGLDVFLLDWGVADELDAGKTFETYCDDLLPDALRRAADVAQAPITVFGYCLGGVLALLTAAARPELPVAALVTLATPVDFRELPLVAALGPRGHVAPDDLIDHSGNVPPGVIHNAIRSLSPTTEVTAWVNLLQYLSDDDYVETHRRMAQWASDHVPFPGAAFRQAADLLVSRNALMTGRIPLSGRQVDLRDLRLPVLNVRATRDHIVTERSTAPLLRLVQGAPGEELVLDGGHIGLVVGRAAQRHNLPSIARWISAHGAPRCR